MASTSLTFISYARNDSEFALSLATDLRDAGAAVWLDQLDIEAGQRWDDAIEEALSNCPRLLVILSPSAVASHNVMDEVSLALEEHRVVIPLLYRACRVPFRLRRLQRVDFSTEYQSAIAQLLEVLGVAALPARRKPRTRKLDSPHNKRNDSSGLAQTGAHTGGLAPRMIWVRDALAVAAMLPAGWMANGTTLRPILEALDRDWKNAEANGVSLTTFMTDLVELNYFIKKNTGTTLHPELLMIWSRHHLGL